MDHDRIVNRRVRRIARDHSCTVNDVHAALDRHPIELDRDRFRSAHSQWSWSSSTSCSKPSAIRPALKDKDVASAILRVKVAERRATLLGLNPPLGHAVQVDDPPAAH